MSFLDIVGWKNGKGKGRVKPLVFLLVQERNLTRFCLHPEGNGFSLRKDGDWEIVKGLKKKAGIFSTDPFWGKIAGKR